MRVNSLASRLAALLLLGVLMPCSLWGQTTVLSQAFYFSAASLDNKDYKDINDLGGYDGWEFTNGYAIKNDYLQLGSASALGSATTPALGITGNAMVLVRVKGDPSTAATWRVTAVDGGQVDGTAQFTIAAAAQQRPSVILLRQAVPGTRLRIEGVEGKFMLMTIKVYSTEFAEFYESFNYLAGDGTEFGIGSNNPSASDLDNTSATLEGNIGQGEGTLYLRNVESNHYTLPALPQLAGRRILLSFRIAEKNQSSWPKLSVSCSGGAMLSPAGSSDLADLEATRTETLQDAQYDAWQQRQYVVSGLTATSQITISGEYLLLDDVALLLPQATVSESVDNAAAIAQAAGLCSVQLQRTLAAGIWNTLCLPFSVTPASLQQAFGLSQEPVVQLLTDVSEGIFTFAEALSDEVIAPGTPFLVQVSEAVVNPLFTDVVLTTDPATAAAASAGGYELHGTYSPTDLLADGTQLFLGTDGKLHLPAAGQNHLKGLRAYFVVPTGATARLRLSDGATTAIDAATGSSTSSAPVYSLSGQQQHSSLLPRGIVVRQGHKHLVK